jgi:2-oxoglutarate dehydrogenase E1 component
MAAKTDPQLDVNSWLQDELREQYRHDRTSIDDEWKHLFETNGTPKTSEANGTPSPTSAPPPVNTTQALQPATPRPPQPQAQAVEPAAGEELQPLRGAAGAIAKNMNASLAIPLATSQRIIPVKVIEENRQLINHHRGLLGKNKISYTHIIGWAVVKAVQANPTLNHAFTENNGEPCRVLRKEINLGIAVDVAAKGGGRSLMVPNLKTAGSLDFARYAAAFDDLVSRARGGKLATPDFQGTTISLTNPGTVGTMASMPRLMPGQGAIIAVGAMDYPAEYRGVSPEVRSALGISKVMSVTCTYDHRIIQGAESGAFLGTLQSLLDGEKGFYEEIFSALRIPYQPVKWDNDPKGASAVPALTAAPGLAKPQTAGTAVDAIKEAAVIQLIHAFRSRGHLLAQLDPLGAEITYNAELDPLTYGLSMWDLDREFYTGNLGGSQGVMTTLRQILEQLRQTYCGKLACEYMHIQEPEQKKWLQERMEPGANKWPIARDIKLRILRRLLDAEEFEHFLHARFIGQKRFSLEGAETAVPIVDAIIDRSADDNVHEIVMGMAHRGRLNALANIVGKPLGQIFSEFEGNVDPSSTMGSGDVKYHLGARGVRRTDSGREITVSLAPNPSHLEAVDPVVEGIVRPKQDRLGDTRRERVIPLLIHGDAAFAGQGVVAETLNLSQLDGYCTGGTIHLIINNQIGFTTLPDDSRSTVYSTDVARMVQAPVFHVNGDDPEAAMRAVELAYDFRQAFKKDVVIDMICYRRHGHNEGDDPGYTQPILYRKINEHASVAVQYGEQLVQEGVVTNAELTQLREAAKGRYVTAFDKKKAEVEKYQVPDLGSGGSRRSTASTAVDRELMSRVIDGITDFPSTFTLHPKLKAFVEKRKDAFAKNGPIDWAFGEALAFASLVLEGTPVRLSGQDSGRGTFSQRHLAFYDYETGERYVPLRHMSEDQATFDVVDSSLSEYAVLGFEFGYSVADPLTLTMWEAQFGDFSNGAQIMIDQFIATAEQKWGQPSGLVMLLPHGYEGQGPEHSSARMERFFVLCAQENIRLANCTTPAQYFHLLRRQARTERKPLVVFTPKSLLRHPKAVSTFEELTTGGFREVIADTAVDMSRVTRVVFCSGKVYYDLLAARDKNNANHIALVRLEQMYPFPEQQINDVLMRYPLTAEVAWVQEEPLNMGAWRFMSDWFAPLLAPTRRKLQYIGRAESASPATGSKKRHDQGQADLVSTALTHPVL